MARGPEETGAKTQRAQPWVGPPLPEMAQHNPSLVTFPKPGTGLSLSGALSYLILTALRIRTHSSTFTTEEPEA